MLDPFDLSETVVPMKHTPHILLVNGPPRSGKDTVGRLLAENYNGEVYITKMAKALKERTHSLYGLFVAGTWEPLAHDFFEDCKDQPHHLFMGIKPRDAYIAVSERLMKPLHGAEVWGNLLVDDIKLHGMDADLVVVTDSGFASEARPVIEHFGAHNVSLIHVIRSGCHFNNDSRSYISLPEIEMSPVPNEGTLIQLAETLTSAVPGFHLKYHVEVQLPAGPEKLDWFQQGRPRDSMEHALAAVESLRQTEYQNRVWRVRIGKNTIAKMVMPGDPPLVDLRANVS